MRRHARIGEHGWTLYRGLGFCLAMAVAAPRAASSVPAPADSLEGGGEGWLPAPEEDLESVEPLEEEVGPRAGALVRGAISQGRFRMRRIAAVQVGRDWRWDVAFLEQGGRWRPGAAVAPAAGGCAAAAGRVSVAQTPTLFAESMRFVRSGSRVRAPRAMAPTVTPARGTTSAALDGGAVAVRGAASFWALAGIRVEDRERIAAAGLGLGRGHIRCAAALGAREALGNSSPGGAAAARRLYGSITVVRRDRGRETSAEFLATRDGPAALFSLERRSGRGLLSARWRYRSWSARRVAAELSAEMSGPASRARLLWRPWSGSASADDGLLELDVVTTRVGAGPLRVRVGVHGLGRDAGGAGPNERFAILEAVVARDRSRSLSFHASRRESAAPSPRVAGATVGARLGLSGGALGEHALLIEATRVRRGGAAAWGSSLHASGTTTLRTRARAGVWLAARGGVGSRSWRLGYALERGEDLDGTRPWSGTIWLRLGRSDARREAKAADADAGHL